MYFNFKAVRLFWEHSIDASCTLRHVSVDTFGLIYRVHSWHLGLKVPLQPQQSQVFGWGSHRCRSIIWHSSEFHQLQQPAALRASE